MSNKSRNNFNNIKNLKMNELFSKSKNENKYDIYDNIDYSNNVTKGLNVELIKQISKIKNEPKWLLDFRLKAYKIFQTLENPDWYPDLSEINIDDINLYINPNIKKENDWNKLPKNIYDTFNRFRYS